MRITTAYADLSVGTVATYRICVRGYLDATWSNRLGGLEITNQEVSEGAFYITQLEGMLTDQAQLFGVLAALYDNRMPLISVECLSLA